MVYGMAWHVRDLESIVSNNALLYFPHLGYRYYINVNLSIFVAKMDGMKRALDETRIWKSLLRTLAIKDLDSFQRIFAQCSVERRMTMLKRKDKYHDTLLHIAAYKGLHDFANVLLDGLTRENRHLVLQIECNCKSTPLQRAANNGHTNIVQFFLGSFDEEQRYSALVKQNKLLDTALHRAGWNGHITTIDYLLNSVNSERRLDVLMVGNQSGNTSLHDMAANGHTHSVNATLQSIDEKQAASLLCCRNNKKVTAFQAACINRNYDIASIILCKLPNIETRIIYVTLNHGSDPSVNRAVMEYLSVTDIFTSTAISKLYLTKDYTASITPVLDDICHRIDQSGSLL